MAFAGPMGSPEGTRKLWQNRDNSPTFGKAIGGATTSLLSDYAHDNFAMTPGQTNPCDRHQAYQRRVENIYKGLDMVITELIFRFCELIIMCKSTQ